MPLSISHRTFRVWGVCLFFFFFLILSNPEKNQIFLKQYNFSDMRKVFLGPTAEKDVSSAQHILGVLEYSASVFPGS